MTDLFVIYIILVAGTFLGFLIIWPCYERIQHYRLYRRISNFFYLSLAIVALILLVYCMGSRFYTDYVQSCKTCLACN